MKKYDYFASPDPERPKMIIRLRSGHEAPEIWNELFEELKKYNTDDVFVIGGASIYNQLMDYCKYGYITKIDAEKPYDKAINNVEKMGWTLEQKGETLTENDINFAFCIFKNPNVKTFEE